MVKLLGVCLLAAGFSLLLPSAPTYDPWSWITWGREIAHGHLDTTGGPSWKPLPVLFTAPFALAGAVDDGLPPLLWLMVARAGALLALAMTYRLGHRLVGGGRGGVLAGTVAAVALALTPQWLRYAAHGNEAPLAVALMLWAVLCHLDGARRSALALGFVACLARPEIFPFLAPYAAWAGWTDPRTRPVIVAGMVALPVLWLGPEWIGSGHPLGAGSQARSQPSWSLSRLDHPWLALLERAHHTLGPLLEVGLVLGFATAWRARDRTVLALGAAGLCWIALVAAMTQSGFSGNARYLLPAVVVACLLTGVAAGRLAVAAPRSMPAAAVGVGLAAVFVAALVPGIGGLATQARTAGRTAALDHALTTAVARAGGPDQVVRHGAPVVVRAFVPHMAYLTVLPIGQIERARGDGLVFAAGRRNPATLLAGSVTTSGLDGPLRVGRWRVFARR